MAAQGILIFGATGDLAQRMLFPSLYFLDEDGLLPEGLKIIGCSRAKLGDERFAQQVETSVRSRAPSISDEDWQRFRKRLSHVAVDATLPESFSDLRARVGDVDELIFYLSTSPSHYGAICSNLQAVGLAHATSRVIVEKPIGRDLASCRAINDALAQTFSEDRIFRIDHYLGKEAVQNLIALRFANTLFEPLWNKVSIAQIQITVAETVGVEDRWSYYDEYGAIRDMVQNHLLQLLCLVAMEPPASLDPDSVRNEKVKVLRSLRPIVGRRRRAQDGARTISRRRLGRPLRAGLQRGSGRAAEQDGNFRRALRQYRQLALGGRAVLSAHGQAAAARSSEIVIQFRDVPHSIFAGADLLANRLTIRLQPEEEISLLLMNKTPSLEQELKPLALNLSLSDAFRGRAAASPMNVCCSKR
jgi:glucose-6-phosphate 1-dehydrogenase